MSILRSRDAGEHWNIESSGSDLRFNSVFFLDPGHGILVGDGGTVLSTSPPVTWVDQLRGEEPTTLREFSLLQNYPNPFNPRTAISYQLLANSFVDLRVYDVLGREVARLVDGPQAAGTHTVHWNAGSIPSGTYICRLSMIEGGGGVGKRFEQSRRMLLVK
jgi:hypothetical protein